MSVTLCIIERAQFGTRGTGGNLISVCSSIAFVRFCVSTRLHSGFLVAASDSELRVSSYRMPDYGLVHTAFLVV